MDKKHYLPLPEGITIKDSGIHGLGLYTNKKLGAGVNLGISHIKDARFENGYSRTPLGGFFNHSTKPNCKVIYEDDFIYLVTLEEIEPGSELTVTYTFYDPTQTHPQHLGAYDFLEIIKAECEKNGVKYLFPNTEKVKLDVWGDIECSGYFQDQPEAILACAIGKPIEKWYEILIHESCHMDQWIENDVLWTNQYANGRNCDKGMEEWLGGKIMPVEEYSYYVKTMQALEVDCEKRSVRKILDLGIGIDVKEYIKRANAYMFFYTVMLFTHKWCDVAPYDVPEIIELMPDHFLTMEEYSIVSEELLDIYKNKCYK